MAQPSLIAHRGDGPPRPPPKWSYRLLPFWQRAERERPLKGDWLYLWIDATYVKARQNGGIVSVGMIVAVGVNAG